MSVLCALGAVGLCKEFYRLAGRDPTYAKLILPALENRDEQAAADDIDKPLAELDSHMSSQLMKAIATLSARNQTKKAGSGGAAAGEN